MAKERGAATLFRARSGHWRKAVWGAARGGGLSMCPGPGPQAPPRATGRQGAAGRPGRSLWGVLGGDHVPLLRPDVHDVNTQNARMAPEWALPGPETGRRRDPSVAARPSLRPAARKANRWEESRFPRAHCAGSERRGAGHRARGMGCRAWAAGCGVPPALHLLTLLLPLDLRLLSSLAVHTLLRADLDELIETLPGAVGSGWGLGLAGGLRCMGHLGRNRPRSLGLGGLPHRVGLAQRKAELASDRTYPNTAPRLPTDRPAFLRVVLWQWVHRG